MKRRLAKYQKKARTFFLNKSGQAALFMAPGTGKTITAIRSVNRPCLVLCRRDDFVTWIDELALEGYSEGRITVIANSSRKLPRRPKSWTLLTYDLLKNRTVAEWVKRQQFAAVVADESHMIKRWKSRRTKAAIKCTRHIPQRLPMTGTPITNHLTDVFSQCLFADDGKTFGRNEYWFKKQYYIHIDPQWVLKRGAKQRIKKKLKSISFYISEDDALNLPIPRFIVKSVPLAKKLRKLYDQILNEWEYTIDNANEPVELDHIVHQLGKLKQVANGFLYDPDGNPIYYPCNKLNLLKELFKSSDYLASKEKVVVWCSSIAEIKRVSTMLSDMGVTNVMFYGSNDAHKKNARKEFYSGKTRVFVGSMDSGVGMNELVVADTAVYFSRSLKVVSRQQSLRRTRRRGSERHRNITYYDLVTEDTLEVKQLKALKKSMSIADEVLSHIRGNGGDLRSAI